VLSLPVLPFDGDVAGGAGASAPLARPGLCAAVLLYFRAIVGFRAKAQP